jgi:hypothetical protein
MEDRIRDILMYKAQNYPAGGMNRTKCSSVPCGGAGTRSGARWANFVKTYSYNYNGEKPKQSKKAKMITYFDNLRGTYNYYDALAHYFGGPGRNYSQEEIDRYTKLSKKPRKKYVPRPLPHKKAMTEAQMINYYKKLYKTNYDNYTIPDETFCEYAKKTWNRKPAICNPDRRRKKKCFDGETVKRDLAMLYYPRITPKGRPVISQCANVRYIKDGYYPNIVK